MFALLLILTTGYRIAASHYDFLGNTAPLMAIAFGGGFLLGIRFWWVPVALLIASDLFLGLWHGGGGVGGYTFLSVGFYLLIAFLAGRFSGRSFRGPFHRWIGLWGGTLISSLLFYGIANSYSFAVWPGYEKSLAGWIQSQTTGVPGIQPPAWMFLRNAWIADTLWCAVAGLLFFVDRRISAAPAEGRKRGALES